jgi:hypothetical protein
MGPISDRARGCELELILSGDALGVLLLILSGEMAWCWSQSCCQSTVAVTEEINNDFVHAGLSLLLECYSPLLEP